MYYYSYEAFEADMRQLLPECRAFGPDTIIALARGGMMGAQLLGYALDVRNIQLLSVTSYDNDVRREDLHISGSCDVRNSGRILIVDDIVDSGSTLRAVKTYLRDQNASAELRCVAPWYKKTACEQPDFSCREATEWIEFFWDRFND